MTWHEKLRTPGWLTGTWPGWAVLVLGALAPIVLLSVYSFRLIASSVRQMVQENNESAARITALLVGHDLEASLQLIETFAVLPSVVEGVGARDEEALRTRLAALVTFHPRIDRGFVTDRQGVLWSDYPRAPESLGRDFSYRDWYRGVSERWETHVSEVYQRHAQPRPLVVALAAPVRVEGEVAGILVIQYRLNDFSQWLRRVQLGNSGYVFVMDHTGRVAAHPHLDMEQGIHDQYAALEPLERARRGVGGAVEYEDPTTGETMIATFTPVSLRGHQWVVVAQQPVAEAYAPIRHLAGQFSVAAVILAALALGVVFVLQQNAQQLARARREAEAANRAKSSFLANMSHEIRTPMNAVIGLTELVLETELTDTQSEYLKMVKDSADSLLSLINDILDFSKIEAGKLELDHLPFQLREVLGDTMKALAIRGRARELEVAFQVAPGVPEMLQGDPYRLRQIVTNLVGNAIKFTERGEVVLELSECSLSDGKVGLHVMVRDTGIGISPEKQQAVFAAFSQADTSTTRRLGGTGLGLAIVARLVELMNGRIWLESEVGKGSTFHFTAEFERAALLPPPQAAAGVLPGLRVLVVDDNETNRVILAEILASWEMLATTVGGAEEALEELRRAREAEQPYGLVLTDVHMPGADGFQLAERMRADDRLHSPVVLMLTSGDGPEDIARCRQVGGAAYLIKPIKQSELFDAIVLSLDMEHAEPVGVEPEGEQSGTAGLSILLAEDSYVNQRLAVGLLTKWGHEVTVVGNGLEAVAAIEQRRFDLALMDVQMPEMDGYQATAVIRKREVGGSHLPIVAMTAHAMKGDREECLAAGMDDYVAKPVRSAELRRVIDRVVGGRVVAPPSQADEPGKPEAAGEDEVDWRRALDAAGGDPQLLKLVAEAFVEEVPIVLKRLETAVAQSDAEGVLTAAHTLKGSAQTFGSRRVAILAERLESLGRDRRCDEAREVLPQMVRETAVVLAAVEARIAKPGS